MKFQAEVASALKDQGDKYRFNSYSSLALEHLMQTFSSLDLNNLAIGYLIMVSLSYYLSISLRIKTVADLPPSPPPPNLVFPCYSRLIPSGN